jgi:hypothetical protein
MSSTKQTTPEKATAATEKASGGLRSWFKGGEGKASTMRWFVVCFLELRSLGLGPLFGAEHSVELRDTAFGTTFRLRSNSGHADSILRNFCTSVAFCLVS